MIEDIIIPFEVDVYEGFAECHGLLYLKENYLVMEFQTKDSIFGVIKSKVKKLFISAEDIIKVDFEKKLFRTKLTIHTKSLNIAQKFPGTKKGEISLKLKKKHREDCTEMISRLNLMISESKLSSLDRD